MSNIEQENNGKTNIGLAVQPTSDSRKKIKTQKGQELAKYMNIKSGTRNQTHR